jgi:hypothetical protein
LFVSPDLIPFGGGLLSSGLRDTLSAHSHILSSAFSLQTEACSHHTTSKYPNCFLTIQSQFFRFSLSPFRRFFFRTHNCIFIQAYKIIPSQIFLRLKLKSLSLHLPSNQITVPGELMQKLSFFHSSTRYSLPLQNLILSSFVHIILQNIF